MIIIGADLSMTSPGLVKAVTNNKLDFECVDWIGFTSVNKTGKIYKDNIVTYKKFDNYIDRSLFMKDKIKEFVIGSEYQPCVDYVAIEDYAFNAVGKSYHIGEFSGMIKTMFYEMGIPVRLYDIVNIKMFATENGNADKIKIGDAFNKYDGVDKIGLTKLDDYKSPKSDVIDAWYIVKLLQTELKLRHGLVKLQDLSLKTIEVFNRVTKSNKENILVRPFLVKAGCK